MAEPEQITKEQYDQMVAERDALKANRDEALTEAKKAKAALKGYEGVDPAEYKTLKDAAAEAERKRALAEGNLDVWKKQVTDAHQKEIEAERKRTEKAIAALEKRKVAKLTEALAQADARKDFMDLLTLKGKEALRLREGDEDWEEYVSDEKGNPLVADGSGTPMTLTQFVEQKLKTQYPGAFNGSGSSGGGASKSRAGGTGSTFNPATSDSNDFMRHLTEIAKGSLLPK